MYSDIPENPPTSLSDKHYHFRIQMNHFAYAVGSQTQDYQCLSICECFQSP